MELIDLPLALDYSNNRKYFSDDVTKPTRFYGVMSDIKVTEAGAANLNVRFTTNTFARDGSVPGGTDLYFAHRWGFSSRVISQKQNPIVITLDHPILIPDGVTALLIGPQADHIRYVKVFVER